MRKLYLVVASCVALVAFMGFSSTAFGLVDPRCGQAGNPTEVLDFSIVTPDSNIEHKVSSLDGNAYACGSDISIFFGGAGSLYNHADIGVPDGVDIADSDLVPINSWSADAIVNILYHDPAGFTHFDANVASQVRTADKADCQNELDTQIVGATPGNEPGSVIVTCLNGTNPVGQNYSWAVRDANDKLWLTIGPMHALLGIEPGLTYVDLQLCAYYGAVGSTKCGTKLGTNPVQYQQANGDAAYPAWGSDARCLDSGQWTGKGIYTVTATKENGTVTPEASTCAPWGVNLR